MRAGWWMTVTDCCALSLSSRPTVYHLGKFGVVTLHYCKNDVHFSLDVNNYCLRQLYLISIIRLFITTCIYTCMGVYDKLLFGFSMMVTHRMWFSHSWLFLFSGQMVNVKPHWLVAESWCNMELEPVDFGLFQHMCRIFLSTPWLMITSIPHVCEVGELHLLWWDYDLSCWYMMWLKCPDKSKG